MLEDIEELKLWLRQFKADTAIELRIANKTYPLWSLYERDRFVDGLLLGLSLGGVQLPVIPATLEEPERLFGRLGRLLGA